MLRCPRSPGPLLLVAGMLGSGVPHAGAQTPGGGEAAAPDRPRPIALELAAVGGALIPLGDLTRNRSAFDTNLASTGVGGGEAAIWHGTGLGVAFEAMYSRMAVNQAAGEQGFVVPGGLGEAEYLAGVFELRYRYRAGGPEAAVQPEWGIGAGFRRLEFDPIAQPDLEDSTDLVGSVRIAVFVPIGRWFGARIGVRATRGAYGAGISDEELSQTDIVVGAGAVVRVF